MVIRSDTTRLMIFIDVHHIFIYLSLIIINPNAERKYFLYVWCCIYVCLILYRSASVVIFHFAILIEKEFILVRQIFIFDIYNYPYDDLLLTFVGVLAPFISRSILENYLFMNITTNHISMQIVRCAWFITESSTWVHILITLTTWDLISWETYFRISKIHAHTSSIVVRVDDKSIMCRNTILRE